MTTTTPESFLKQEFRKKLATFAIHLRRGLVNLHPVFYNHL